ncbi:tauD/TfdA-like domain-containing protein [Artemisia annua]|uniref:TauD/TfdA-like domain-containing protein n=1 Tax=Artemisia annua TaxID=35608 RepID=A0A2U1PQV1_ARTAN|nr:tauD/TfdA-like domain-containing protein [Artemisia annua]
MDERFVEVIKEAVVQYQVENFVLFVIMKWSFLLQATLILYKHHLMQYALFQAFKFSCNFISPVVLTPNLKLTKIVELTEAIKANRSWLDSLLHRSGAVLFRGFSVSSASDFNDVVESSGYEDFSYGVGGAGSRTKVIGRVYTANEASPDQYIPFHHEMSHV